MIVERIWTANTGRNSICDRLRRIRDALSLSITGAASRWKAIGGAVIPMRIPEEATEELEFATRQLGSKVGMFGSCQRPLTTTLKPAPLADRGKGCAATRSRG